MNRPVKGNLYELKAKQTSSTFIGGNIENDVEVSGSFTFLGTSMIPQSFIKIDEDIFVTGSHYGGNPTYSGLWTT